MLDRDCERPRPLSARGHLEDKSSPPLHRSAGNPLLPPSTPPSIPAPETRPAPFESLPPNPPSVSFFQTYPPASASHPPLLAPESHSLPAAACCECPASANT